LLLFCSTTARGHRPHNESMCAWTEALIPRPSCYHGVLLMFAHCKQMFAIRYGLRSRSNGVVCTSSDLVFHGSNVTDAKVTSVLVLV